MTRKKPEMTESRNDDRKSQNDRNARGGSHLPGRPQYSSYILNKTFVILIPYRCVGAPRRSCLRPSPQYEYGKDGWMAGPCILQSAVHKCFTDPLCINAPVYFNKSQYTLAGLVPITSYCVGSSTDGHISAKAQELVTQADEARNSWNNHR